MFSRAYARWQVGTPVCLFKCKSNKKNIRRGQYDEIFCESAPSQSSFLRRATGIPWRSRYFATVRLLTSYPLDSIMLLILSSLSGCFLSSPSTMAAISASILRLVRASDESSPSSPIESLKKNLSGNTPQGSLLYTTEAADH